MAQEQVDPAKLAQMIEYSEKYQDDTYEYRCVGPRPSPERAAASARARPRPQPLTPVPHPTPLRCLCLLPCSHVILPKELAKSLQPKRLLAEAEWRALGVQQSRGWANYAIHRPEPHILLFRRELGTDPMTGKVNATLRAQAVEAYNKEFQ
jgi:cyclin-dependent kinase regulatory subunit CKS1